jgi:hypothetical protein
MTSPPATLSEDTCVDKKRKHVEELASLSTSIQRATAGEAPVQEEDLELFDSWPRKCSVEFYDFVVLAFFLLGCIKSISSCFLSDNEDPKRDAAITPSAENITIGEPSVQEAEPAVKSLKAPRISSKKVPVARSTKRSKKSKEADVSLQVHDSTSSPDDVSDCPSLCFFV